MAEYAVFLEPFLLSADLYIAGVLLATGGESHAKEKTKHDQLIII